MDICAKNNKLSGDICVPGSKSVTIRTLLLASMSNGICKIHNPLMSQDCISTMKAIEQIGAKIIENQNGVITILGTNNNLVVPQNPIDVGNSGSLLYFLSPIMATLDKECVFTGDKSICKRPVGHLIDALIQFGVKAESLKEKNLPPFKLCGPIDISKKIVTEGKLSQYISGFMMAALRLNGQMHIELTNPAETPYLLMTKEVISSLGADCQISKDFKQIKVKGPLTINAFERTIPSDWEGVAFPLIAALISKSKITIKNIDSSGIQGDDKIIEVLESAGADIIWDKVKNTLTVDGTTFNSKECHLKVDISSFPDAICALSVMACFIEGSVTFTNIDICRKKETDRIFAMRSELTKLGANVQEKDECLVVYGKKDGCNLKGGIIESYDDHRIAMSFACLGLGLKDGDSVIIKNAECADVSFPDFYNVMNTIGANFVVC